MGLVACLLALGPLGQQPPPAAHWAYAPVVRPATPAGQHPIDALLDAAHRQQGLAAAAPADPATLLRRLHLDLIGLPPSPAEVAAFAAAPTEAAYAAAVDRLLASPHYGERQAIPWLDLARYADTDGFNFDKPRPSWPWRDWVIEALNRDLPYDRFTVEQLAGDLLPDADDRTRLATGFHCNTPTNDEGGVDPDEARWQRLLDRASTTATVWLGATMHCAQCHDHKYDPVSQREFYGLVAYFAPADEAVVAVAGQRRLVLREDPNQPASTALRRRGSYDQPGEVVAAGVPRALGPALPADAPPNRLGLARWLTRPDHPLTARVHVNRLWDQLFGRPLVATPEDFGRQAPAPELLPLLDWLASEFVRLGWSQKALLRTIATSQAYRRQSGAAAAARDRDPDNRWFARQGRFRLDAELVRDLQLSASGLLVPQLLGPPVFPLQADTRGVIPTNKADLRWQPSDGQDRHRRGIYTFWRRTATFVQFALFDAPSREVCTVRRQRSNTPLQALAGLNDPAAWAAAQALGQRLAEHPGSDRDRLAFGFRCCCSRAPEPAELDRLEQALAAEPSPLRWALLANALLNLDEALCRN